MEAREGAKDKSLPVQSLSKEYIHLTQKERMIQGFPYSLNDAELVEAERRARALLRQYNSLPEGDLEQEMRILKELLSPNSGGNLRVDRPFFTEYGFSLTIGEGTEIGFDCHILDSAPVVIGEKCLIGPGVHIYASTHPLLPEERQEFELAKRVRIGDGVWIGGRAVICPGVVIGEGVTVGAGSVVTKNIPAFVVVAGNPARIIRILPGYVENEDE